MLQQVCVTLYKNLVCWSKAEGSRLQVLKGAWGVIGA